MELLLGVKIKMENLNAFNFSKMKLLNEKPSKIISWITILCILSLVFILISILFKINKYYITYGYVEIKDNYNLKIIIDKSSFPIKKNYKLYIEDNKYDYKIININEMDLYYEILVYCNLDNELLINNNILKIKFEIGTTTLMKEFKEKIKKGMNQ